MCVYSYTFCSFFTDGFCARRRRFGGGVTPVSITCAMESVGIKSRRDLSTLTGSLARLRFELREVLAEGCGGLLFLFCIEVRVRGTLGGALFRLRLGAG